MPGGCRDARSGATVAIRSDQSAESAGPNAGAETGGGASSRSETGPAGASASRAGPQACHIGSVTGSRAECQADGGGNRADQSAFGTGNEAGIRTGWAERPSRVDRIAWPVQTRRNSADQDRGGNAWSERRAGEWFEARSREQQADFHDSQ